MSDHDTTGAGRPLPTSELQLCDLDADQQLLSLPGTSLVIFTSPGCASCRYARERLPALALPVERLVWIDAGASGGLVQRYDVFHLPALFVVHAGQFQGALNCRLGHAELVRCIDDALRRVPDELP